MNGVHATQWSYRPTQMPEEMFLKTFIGREKELEMIFSHIYNNMIPSALAENKKNLFIKAERGIGKTSLFLAAKYQLKAQRAGLLKQIIPVFFNEQEDFNSVEKLILRTFEIILEESAPEISLVQTQLWKKNLQQLKEHITTSFDILKSCLLAEGKKLVLFLENFDAIVYRVLRKKGKKNAGKNSSQDIFAQLVADPDIILICSGLEDPESAHDYGYRSFVMVELKPLDDFYELIIKRAQYDNNLFLLANQEKLKNKIRAFQYLTGGNTRLMIHLYECLVEKNVDTLVYLLNDMINKSTPLYEWILEKFVDYESREILNALARRGGNATVKEMAEDTFNTEESVRTLLNRLRKKNFVQNIKEKREKSDIYIMVPMMFFIWYQKSVLQRKGVILDFFIHFVDLFFDPTELKNKLWTKKEIEPKDNTTDYTPYFNYIKHYTADGESPHKSFYEKWQKELLDKTDENEQMIYELVQSRQDDTVLQTQIHKAFSAKAENRLDEAANVFRIVARGYFKLGKSVGQSFLAQVEENIRRAIEIYQGMETEPLETVRCLLILVDILSDTDRTEELRTFAQTIIRIGEKPANPLINVYVGNAYKFQGYAETDTKQKLQLFDTALKYFEGDIGQTILVLSKIGDIYLEESDYEKALNYLDKGLEMSKNKNHVDLLEDIFFKMFLIFQKAGDISGGLNKIDEILEWMDNRSTTLGLGILYYWKAEFLVNNHQFLEAEDYFQKCMELAKEKNESFLIILAAMGLAAMYSSLNKREKIEKVIVEIESMILNATEINLPTEFLERIAALFYDINFIEKALAIGKKILSIYQTEKNQKGEATSFENIGKCYGDLNQFAQAEENFQHAIEIAEKNDLRDVSFEAKMSYSFLLHNEGKSDEAITLLENLLQEKADDGPIELVLFLEYLTKSRDIFRENDFNDSLALANKALKFIANIPIDAIVQGLYYIVVLSLFNKHGKRIYPFLKEIDTVLSVHYENPEKGALLKTFKYVVELVKGKKIEKIAKDLTPDQRSVLQLIDGEMIKDSVLEEVAQFIKDGETQKAIEKLELSLRDKQRDIRKLKKLAELYKQTSQLEKYAQTLKTIVRINPDQQDSLFELATHYLYHEEIGKAEQLGKRILDKYPEKPKALVLMAMVERKKGNYEIAINYMKISLKFEIDDEFKVVLKLELVENLLLIDNLQSIQDTAKILEEIEIADLKDLLSKYRFYFLKIILALISQKRVMIKAFLTTLLYMIKDSSIDDSTDLIVQDLMALLKKKLNSSQDFQLIHQLHQVMLKELSVSSFIKSFPDYIDSRLVEEINENIHHPTDHVFLRLLDEKENDIKRITTICGSRLRLEALIFQITSQFPVLNLEQQEQMILILNGIFKELPEAYQWLVLDFYAIQFVNITLPNQENIVRLLLEQLNSQGDRPRLLKEIRGFLNMVKTMVENTLKVKIEKEMLVSSAKEA